MANISNVTNKLSFKNLIKFLKQHDLIYMALSVYLGIVLEKFLESFIKDIFVPIVSTPIPNSIKQYSFDVLNMNVNNFITNIFRLLMSIIVSYLFVRIVMGVRR